METNPLFRLRVWWRMGKLNFTWTDVHKPDSETKCILRASTKLNLILWLSQIDQSANV